MCKYSSTPFLLFALFVPLAVSFQRPDFLCMEELVYTHHTIVSDKPDLGPNRLKISSVPNFTNFCPLRKTFNEYFRLDLVLLWDKDTKVSIRHRGQAV